MKGKELALILGIIGEMTYLYLADFFENQPNEICSHMLEKASKGRFFRPDKLQNHSNEGKRKEKKKERGGRKEEKRQKQWLHS